MKQKNLSSVQKKQVGKGHRDLAHIFADDLRPTAVVYQDTNVKTSMTQSTVYSTIFPLSKRWPWDANILKNDTNVFSICGLKIMIFLKFFTPLVLDDH